MDNQVRDAAAAAALRAGPEAAAEYLKVNDTEGFGCACDPSGAVCGPCKEYRRQEPLRALVAAAQKETP